MASELLIPLFLKEKRLLPSLTKAILAPLSGPKPISLILFGSQLDEKEARPDSDFDILCVIPDEIDLKKFNREISQAEIQTEKEFGNRLSLIIMNKREFLRRKKKGDSLVLNIENKNRLLFGKHLREIK